VRVEVEHLPESQVQLQIEIDPDALGLAVGRAYQKLAGRYSVPGFRPGKAPRAVLERASAIQQACHPHIPLRTLDALHVATTLRDLLSRPSNRLEALKRDRIGQHSIRINDQYRVCFHWREGDAYDVEIVDYH